MKLETKEKNVKIENLNLNIQEKESKIEMQKNSSI